MLELCSLKYEPNPTHPSFSGSSNPPVGPRLYLSPVAFDEDTLVLVDAQGGRYQIVSFSGDKDFVVAQIKEHIEEMRKAAPIAYGARHTTTAEDLKQLHVRQLLGLLRLYRRQNQLDWYRWRNHDEAESTRIFPLFDEDDLRAALAEKPHVPNKKEARAARRAASKRGN